MGAELVLTLRSPPFYGASAFTVHRALLDLDSSRRKRTFVSAETCRSNPERNPDWKFNGAIDSHHHHHRHQHQQFLHHHLQCHNQHNHPWQKPTDIGRQPGRLGSGFSMAFESDSETEKIDSRSSFCNNAKCFASPTKGDFIARSNICAGGGVAGVDVPFSLRMLKRKQQDCAKSSGLSEVGNSLLNAFSSVVTMMKTLQSYTLLHMRRQSFEQETGGLLNQVQREMHVSFVWLFQQVFACTPELMVLVMVLLANFTAFSVVNNVPVLPMLLNAPPLSTVSLFSNNVEVDKGFREMFYMSLKPSPCVTMDKAESLCISEGSGIGNGGGGTYHILGTSDHSPGPMENMGKLNKALYSVNEGLSLEQSRTPPMASHTGSSSEVGLSGEDTSVPDFSASAAALAFEEFARGNTDDDDHALPSIMDEGHESVHSLGTPKSGRDADHFSLSQMTVRSLVAPVIARIEDDNYTCYDKTDLVYRDAINNDSNNSLLLANYAQFLFLVRKDHDRAEELFQKAVICDPYDCDAVSRFANFLWLARHNLGAAEKAYQAALRADPANSYHAANYAHFLWNSGL